METENWLFGEGIATFMCNWLHIYEFSGNGSPVKSKIA
jgi:hypothetical protein